VLLLRLVAMLFLVSRRPQPFPKREMPSADPQPFPTREMPLVVLVHCSQPFPTREVPRAALQPFPNREMPMVVPQLLVIVAT
jgi:hypothetical protein